MENIKDTSFAQLTITPLGIKAQLNLPEGGGTVYKNIALQSLIKALNKDQEFDTGFLMAYGPGAIAVKRYIKSGSKEIILIEASPANRPISFNTGYNDAKEFQAIRYPGLLMSVILETVQNRTQIKETRIFATTGPILRESDKLFKFPFGNVYTENRGNICWGQVDRGRIDSVSKACSLMNMFLEAGMNYDLYHDYGFGNLSSFLISLENATTFPYEKLSFDLTVAQLLELLKSKRT